MAAPLPNIIERLQRLRDDTRALAESQNRHESDWRDVSALLNFTEDALERLRQRASGATPRPDDDDGVDYAVAVEPLGFPELSDLLNFSQSVQMEGRSLDSALLPSLSMLVRGEAEDSAHSKPAASPTLPPCLAPPPVDTPRHQGSSLGRGAAAAPAAAAAAAGPDTTNQLPPSPSVPAPGCQLPPPPPPAGSFCRLMPPPTAGPVQPSPFLESAGWVNVLPEGSNTSRRAQVVRLTTSPEHRHQQMHDPPAPPPPPQQQQHQQVERQREPPPGGVTITTGASWEPSASSTRKRPRKQGRASSTRL